MAKIRRFVTVAAVVVIVLVLYYVIDYAVVSNGVRKHVGAALSTSIQSIGSMKPSQLNYLVPANARKDTYINLDNRWLVVNPSSLFVLQQVEYNTWQQLNEVYSSPVSLVSFVNMTLVPGKPSMMVITNARFVGPFGIPRTISVIETQPIKEFPIQ